MRNKLLFIIYSTLMTLPALLLLHSSPASAVTAADWRAGRIVDDAIFTNKNSMSFQQIQEFLVAKMPVCDTGGAQYVYDSTYGDTVTRATYGERRNNPKPFTCLKDYYENPTTKANNYGGLPVPEGSRSAAQLIWDAGQAYNISPKTLLVTLQKEQALISDDWPFKNQFLYAMGAYCPDSGPGGSANCDPTYAGFGIQMKEAARLFRYYLDNMNQPWWSYKKPGNNYILWNISETNCGGSNVYIESLATAALYTYTPYQPNQAALNNMYGTGDGCSAYGNRNFWRMFNDWFGSTTSANGTILLSQGLQLSKQMNVFNKDTITASYEIHNTASYTVYAGGFGVCARANGQYYDFGFIHHQSLAANQKVIISFTKQLDVAGDITVFLCSYNEEVGGWVSDRYPYDSTYSKPRQISFNVQENPLLMAGIELGPTNPGINQPVNAYVTIKNGSTNSVNIGSVVIAARDPAGRNTDFPLKNDVILTGNETKTFVWSRVFTTPGIYSFYIANWNGVWTTAYPKSADGSVKRQLSWPILDNPLISSGITVTTPSPTVNSQVDATITFRNTSNSDMNLGSMVIAARDPYGNNVDFPIKNDVIIPANSTQTVTWSRTFTSPGNYNLFVAHWYGTWDTVYPKSIDGTIKRQATMTLN